MMVKNVVHVAASMEQTANCLCSRPLVSGRICMTVHGGNHDAMVQISSLPKVIVFVPLETA